MASPDPVLCLIAGPNGAGKATLATPVIAPVTRLPFINADVIAAQRWPSAQADHACDASQVAAEQRRELIGARASFITETVFSHPSKLALIRDAQEGVPRDPRANAPLTATEHPRGLAWSVASEGTFSAAAFSSRSAGPALQGEHRNGLSGRIQAWTTSTPSPLDCAACTAKSNAAPAPGDASWPTTIGIADMASPGLECR